MAVIQPYTETALPTGLLNVRADPNDFGANVGAAVANFGGALNNYAEAEYENEVTDEVTNIHVEMAKRSASWQQTLGDMANQTQPGDSTFVPRVSTAMEQDLDAFGQTIKTPKGQQLFARMSANMTSMFTREAVSMQSRMAGDFAKNQYATLTDSLSTAAAQDYSRTEALVQQGTLAIDDPDGRFAKVPEATREAFRRSLREEIEFSAAKGFVRRFPAAALGDLPGQVRSKLQDYVSKNPTPGMPPDLGADTVKPYDQSKIDFVAKRVAEPSPYDQMFKDAAQLYNLDWRELKMRSVAESNLNPAAQSSQGAGGIMQFTQATADSLGVDRNDPAAAIPAAAKLLAGYRSKAGGDMAKVDRMYYGGESGTAWGPNTEQYAANLAAARSAIGLGTSIAPEQFALDPADAMGQSQGWKKPTTGIAFIDNLPPDKFFSVLSEAEHYQRAYDSQSERNRLEVKYNKEKLAEATMDNYTQRIVNPNESNGGKLTEVEIVSNANLSTSQKQHMISYIGQFAREQQSRQEPKSNPEEVRGLMLRIHAADSDPAKLYNNEPIYQALSEGKISTAEFGMLNREVSELRSTSTNGFRKDVNTLRGHVARALQQNTMLQYQELVNPGVTATIAYRFDRDLEDKIDALRKENKSPNILLDPSSPDYVLKEGALAKFFPAGTLKDAATKVVGKEAVRVSSKEDYDKLPSGTSYIVPDGRVMVKP